MNSADASDVPPLPREPVYFIIATPLLINDAFMRSETSGNVGSNAALTSADRQRVCESTV